MTGRPPDAPRPRERSGAAIVLGVVALALLGAIGLVAFALLSPPPLRSLPIATPATPQTIAIALPTVDPVQHLAYVAMATFYAPTATPLPPTATPSPTPDATVFCLPALVEASTPCEWPQPTLPPPTPLPTCRTPVAGETCLPRDVSVFRKSS